MDINKFMTASLAMREASISVPELSEFFPEGDEPVWKVRALTAAELARAKAAAEDNGETMKALISALAGGADSEKATAIRKACGLSQEETPKDISQRIEMLSQASVSPEIGEGRRDFVVRLAEMFPTTFYQLTNEILNLTGKGAEMGKRRPSGNKKKSEQG